MWQSRRQLGVHIQIPVINGRIHLGQHTLEEAVKHSACPHLSVTCALRGGVPGTHTGRTNTAPVSLPS